MISTIMKSLNGHGSEAASLEAALLQLGRDRDEARAKIDSLQKERHQALLDDASDSNLDKLERLLDRALIRLEKLNLAEPQLLEKLSAARSAARQRRWASIREAWLSAAAEFLASARATAEKHESLTAIVAQAQREGFAAEASATMPATPNMNGNALLAADLLDIFERQIKPPSAPGRRPAKAAAPATARPLLPHERVSHGDVAGPVSLGIHDQPRSQTPRRADDVSPLEAGQVRAVVIRAGFTDSTGAACRAGQRIRLSRKIAQEAARNGAVEIIEELVPVSRDTANAQQPNEGVSK